MTVLEVTVKGKQQEISYPADHPKAAKIKKWFANGLSAGYVEYLLTFDKDPHCNACRDTKCESVGNGDDACRGFMFGELW